MKISFNIHYGTQAGEDLHVNIKMADGTLKEMPLTSSNGFDWTAQVDLKLEGQKYVDYFYTVHRMQTELRREWSMMTHRLELIGQEMDSYVIYDIWYDVPEDAYLYSSAFTQCIHRRDHALTPKQDCRKTMRMKVRAPQLRQGESLRILGSAHPFGNWDAAKAVVMYEHENNEWAATIDVADIMGETVWFKFIIVDGNGNVIWEKGGDRSINIPEVGKKQVVVYEMHTAYFDIPQQKMAGTAIPVFSLRSTGSFGVGDFGDLKMMVDWVAKTGQRILQILPINDTTLTHTWTDSYPYSCVSIYALHPMYCDFRQLPALADEAAAKDFEAKRVALNALSKIDYEAMTKAKNAYLHLIYAQESKAVFASAEFKAWFAEEQEWLVPYAQYSVLRDKYGTPDYTQWPDHNVWNEDHRKVLTSPRTKAYREVAYHYYVQYVLAQQMKGAHEYAREKGVVLKGDIAIGVNRHGSDAWMEPRYFNLNGQAGAPPDDFSINGQNWGFPTYNWDEMLKDDCAWWVRRFANMSKYFDAYRIDHVLGFFRIWEIPVHSVHGLLGQFQPSLGMTLNEIQQYGLKWDDEYLEPLITDWIIDRWFPGKSDLVRELFVEPWHDDKYRMREGFRTQREIEAFFNNPSIANLPSPLRGGAGGGALLVGNHDLRDTLYALVSNVLFLRDHKNPDLYHPRISAQLDPCYEALWGEQKDCFNNLYNDYFYRRNNHFWYLEAMKKLPRLVNATRMLVCAEDLGMVPDCVPWVMDELRILSLEIQSMPKETCLRFGDLSHNPYRSVCTISSHDTATLRMWWDEDEERTQDYYRTRLSRGDAAPHPLPGWLARDVIYRHLACPSMLCILTLQDWLATDEKLRLKDASAERINIPANPKHYWRYRMHLNLEDLLAADEFNYSVQGLINDTQR